MKIKKGDRFLCTASYKDVYTEGKIYLSEKDGNLTDNHNVRDFWNIAHLISGGVLFERILSDEEEDKLILQEAKNQALTLVTHKEKGGNYKIQTDRASVQFGDTWLRAVVYECLDTGVIYVREYENFKNRFVNV